MVNRELAKPSFKEAFKFWLKLGFISFGGPAGQIAIMHTFLVEQKKWISESKFMHALNYCMLLPGPEAQQLATYIGWLFHGIRGGIIAGLLFILPSIVLLLGLSILYVEYGDLVWVSNFLNGLKPAVIAIIIGAMIKIGKKSLLGLEYYLIAIISFVLIFFFHVPFPYIVLGIILLSFLWLKFVQKSNSNSLSNSVSKSNNNVDESDYLINKNSTIENLTYSKKTWGLIISIAPILFVLPLIATIYFTDKPVFWTQLISFFTQAAFVTFGGAYAVLPYVAQVSVIKYQWLTQFQMMDGLALGESTPGPLIIILIFVGFMAGYNIYDGSIIMGGLGLFLTALYTFLPSFVFILVGAPFVEKSQQNILFKKILGYVTAAVVGVILNLSFYLTKALLIPAHVSWYEINWLGLLWIVISVFALQVKKWNMILWLVISGIVGVFISFLSL
ncbi:MAG: chromate efflux transporter [Cytophagaceae bacterium]